MLHFAPTVLAALAAAATLTHHSTHAWPQFKKNVPNGSGNLTFKLTDLGHAEGTMLRNKFGLAFNVPREWTTTLCEADSDGDGQTNGQELGDPCCVWMANSTAPPQRTIDISNPGNKSSTADPRQWKNLDCAAIRLSAVATKSSTPAPAAKSSTPVPATMSSASSLLPTGIVVVTGAAVLAAAWS